MSKRIISIILITSLIFGSFTAHAILETPDENIDTDYVRGKDGRILNESDLLKIDNNKIRVNAPVNAVNSLNDDNFKDYKNITKNIELQCDMDNQIQIGANITEIENYVSLNKDDEENPTEEEDVVIEGKITPIEKTSKSSSPNISLAVDNTYRMNCINSIDSNALKNQTGKTNFIGDNMGQEYVDPLTGNLIVTQTDLILPGVDGLDLNLSRYYSLAEAELYTKSVGIETNPQYNTYVLENGGFVVTETVTDTETNQTSTYTYFYLSQKQANKRAEEIESRDTKDGLYRYSATVESKPAGEIVTVDYYYTSELTSTSYSRKRSNLGAGWSWCFPSIEIIKDDFYDTTEIPRALYYHDGKGNTMEIEYDRNNGYSFSNYVGKDITFDDYFDYMPGYNHTRIDYIINDSNGTEYYFGPQGELCIIKDMYGNKILFTYIEKDFYGAENSLLIRTITDTVGRTVTFYYNDEGCEFENITVTVASPIPSEGTLSFIYEKRMLNVERGDGTLLSKEPILDNVTNPLGEKTVYYPAKINGEINETHPILFTFADKSFNSEFVYNTSGYAQNQVYLLGNIVRRHSNTYYDYDLCERNLGHGGVCQAYRVCERGDFELVIDDDSLIIERYDKNVVDYDYKRDYTGYPDYNSIESITQEQAKKSYIARTWMESDNANIRYDFYKIDNAALMKYEVSNYSNPVGNDLTITKENTGFSNKQPYETILTYSNGSYSYKSFIQRSFANNNYKSSGKLEYITQEIPQEMINTQNEEKYSTRYEYDKETGFMVQKSWYQNENKECVEEYEYDENIKNRLVCITKADNSEEKYNYIFNEDGKVIKKTTTTNNDLGTTVIEENYTSDTTFAFPSTIVKTVTANNITTTQTTAYTYNLLLGVVTSKTDSDGNTTYYEYDNLGRPTKIIYPTHQAYTSYNTLGQKIMPVEEIEYKTVLRDDWQDLSNNEFLVAQEIYSSLTYYDVTNISTATPLQIDLTNLQNTFYFGVVDYYMGTGEVFEQNVIDMVEGQADCITTKYYYNTIENTVQEIDAQGNPTTVYYDGLGREVKIIDKFNNYHITDYNLSGNGAGFKSQTYFVPSNDRTKKDNIVEHTYDRNQRVISKKAYSNYSNDYVETQYSYDIIGNVIGITDPNGNLNEDGYTESYIYNKLNRVTKIKNAKNEIITNTYDNNGNIKAQKINGSTLYTRYYDGEGKLVSDTDNSNNSNLYSYDSQGRLELMQNKNGIFNEFSYNSNGFSQRVQYIENNSGVIDRRYAHTNPYLPSAVYDLYWELDNNNEVEVGYIYTQQKCDVIPSGKVSSKSNNYSYYTGWDGVEFTSMSQYLYDELGNITSTLHGSVVEEGTVLGDVTHYTYEKGRLSKVQIDGSSIKNTSDSVNARYEFYDDGKLKSITFPTLNNGTVLKSEYVYDGLSRLTSLINYKGTNILSAYSYTYDNNGNILTTNETVGQEQNNVTYTYDELNRISTVSGSKGADSYYEYDERGNRKENFEQIDFLSEENVEYVYSEENKLIYVQKSDDSVTFDYNADGYRFVKDSASSDYPTFYIYDESGRLMSEAHIILVDDEVIVCPVKQYIWGADRVLAQRDINGNSYYYIYNGHGDVVQIVDTDGNIVNSYDYDVWGNFLKKEETIENHFTYFGQTYDEETGLYYLRARYYDPTTGRFTQQDPAEDGYNWYVYGNQNPVIYADYTGEETITASAALVLLGVVAVYAAGLYTIKKIQDLSQTMLAKLYESKAYREALYSKRSDEIDWGNNNTHHHTLHGSKATKEFHSPIWNKFNIDPNNNNSWEKLLPILKTVLDTGYQIGKTNVSKRGKVMGQYIKYAKQFVDKGVEVVVKIYVNTEGDVWFSDAYGNFIK